MLSKAVIADKVNIGTTITTIIIVVVIIDVITVKWVKYVCGKIEKRQRWTVWRLIEEWLVLGETSGITKENKLFLFQI